MSDLIDRLLAWFKIVEAQALPHQTDAIEELGSLIDELTANVLDTEDDLEPELSGFEREVVDLTDNPEVTGYPGVD